MKKLIFCSLALISFNLHAGSVFCTFSEPVDIKLTEGICKYKEDGEKKEIQARFFKHKKNLAIGLTSNEYVMNITCLGTPASEIVKAPLVGAIRSGAFGHGFIGGNFLTPEKKHCFAAGIQAMSIHGEVGAASIHFEGSESY